MSDIAPTSAANSMGMLAHPLPMRQPPHRADLEKSMRRVGRDGPRGRGAGRSEVRPEWGQLGPKRRRDLALPAFVWEAGSDNSEPTRTGLSRYARSRPDQLPRKLKRKRHQFESESELNGPQSGRTPKRPVPALRAVLGVSFAAPHCRSRRRDLRHKTSSMPAPSGPSETRQPERPGS